MSETSKFLGEIASRNELLPKF